MAVVVVGGSSGFMWPWYVVVRIRMCMTHRMNGQKAGHSKSRDKNNNYVTHSIQDAHRSSISSLPFHPVGPSSPGVP